MRRWLFCILTTFGNIDTPYKDNEEKIETAQQEDFPTTMASSPDSMSRVEVFLI